jgi:hypothetical protein
MNVCVMQSRSITKKRRQSWPFVVLMRRRLFWLLPKVLWWISPCKNGKQASLHEKLFEFPKGFSLVIFRPRLACTLGAGVASLITILLHHDKSLLAPQDDIVVKSVAYAPPAVLSYDNELLSTYERVRIEEGNDEPPEKIVEDMCVKPAIPPCQNRREHSGLPFRQSVLCGWRTRQAMAMITSRNESTRQCCWIQFDIPNF